MTTLEVAEQYFRSIAPIANEMDEQVEVLRSTLQGLGDRNLLALRVPKEWDGAGFNTEQFSQFQELAARFSGALTFLQTQHQSAAAMLAKSENQALKQVYLPFMGSGQKLVGIGFSHLRRESNPPLKAVQVADGYRLHGQIPWITGFGFFESVLIAALLPDGQAVYGMVPFTPQTTSGEISFSKSMPLAAMTATNTVTAELTEWFLSDEDVAFIAPARAIHKSDRVNVLNQSFFALGCAQAGLDIVESAIAAKPFLSIAPTADALSEELNTCRREIYSAQQNNAAFQEKLRLRAWSIELAVRCAHAAVIVSSGAANSQHHPAQRVYREALVFSVSGQTIDVLEASLTRLVKPF